MHVYLLVNVLLLGITVALWCQGKLPHTTPAAQLQLVFWNLQFIYLHTMCILCVSYVYEGRSKFVVERKCVTKLVSPLSFYMVSCFYIFLPLPKHSFEASLLGSSSLPIFVCMHWETLVVFVVSYVVPPLRCSGGLSNQQVFWKENCFLACFGH